ncbi:MAG: hypothetical protein RMX65_007045 [Nostoc sp. DedQUE01]|nr:hypothetical protein [Nostoc sp. DedQUE01]
MYALKVGMLTAGFAKAIYRLDNPSPNLRQAMNIKYCVKKITILFIAWQVVPSPHLSRKQKQFSYGIPLSNATGSTFGDQMTAVAPQDSKSSTTEFIANN